MERRRPLIRVGTPIRLIAVIILLVFGCACDDLFQSDQEYTYRVPQQTGDGWTTASLGDMGMDTVPFIELMNDLQRQDDHPVHGIVVAKDGRLVFEEYFPGEHLDLSNLRDGYDLAYEDFDRNTLHCLASDSKSVTSILLGIAVDEGLIGGADETMFSFFPDYSGLSDAVKKQITLTHMLAMASGLPWNEGYPYADPRNDLVAMINSEDPIGYVLSKSTVAAPGTRFIYNSGTTNLLGEVIRRTSGVTLSAFAEQHLFAPLGISSYEWYGFPNAPEMVVASSTLYLRPRDMAKIGQLYLDGGVWNGTRVVSENWVTASTSEVIDVSTSESPAQGYLNGYGLQWWLGTFDTGDTDFYTAAGWGGQFIIVIPGHEMVVVITAGDFEDPDYDALLGIADDYVLRALGN
ncbi:MAG: serine hydrolase [Gemmatimonadota bacterium]|nr:MAG: serine hydrolase [Gemmatimonadota bacterium]